jgi:hypothetical protein
VKIPRPKPPETEFRRKRGPPPQATKLLIASLSAGLIFMALLAIVFVPRYLENLNPPLSTLVTLELNTTGGSPRIVVTYALYNLNLSRFNATLLRDNATVAALPAGLGDGSAALSFSDANRDGMLDAGDSFALQAAAQGSYRFEVWQVDVGHLVGLKTWTGALL